MTAKEACKAIEEKENIYFLMEVRQIVDIIINKGGEHIFADLHDIEIVTGNRSVKYRDGWSCYHLKKRHIDYLKKNGFKVVEITDFVIGDYRIMTETAKPKLSFLGITLIKEIETIHHSEPVKVTAYKVSACCKGKK